MLLGFSYNFTAIPIYVQIMILTKNHSNIYVSIYNLQAHRDMEVNMCSHNFGKLFCLEVWIK